MECWGPSKASVEFTSAAKCSGDAADRYVTVPKSTIAAETRRAGRPSPGLPIIIADSRRPINQANRLCARLHSTRLPVSFSSRHISPQLLASGPDFSCTHPSIFAYFLLLADSKISLFSTYSTLAIATATMATALLTPSKTVSRPRWLDASRHVR